MQQSMEKKMKKIITLLLFCLITTVYADSGDSTTIITPDGKIVTCIQTGTLITCF